MGGPALRSSELGAALKTPLLTLRNDISQTFLELSDRWRIYILGCPLACAQSGVEIGSAFGARKFLRGAGRIGIKVTRR